MVVDVELTLNRFGFYKPSENKIQIGPIRFSIWKIKNKHALSFEINWKSHDDADAHCGTNDNFNDPPQDQ